MSRGIYIRTPEYREKQRRAILRRKEKYGYINSPEMRAKVSKKLKGRVFTDEWRKKMSINNHCRGKCGALHRNWQGGKTNARRHIENTLQYKNWRQQVFLRDKFTCQKCNDGVGGNLNAHHIKPIKILMNEAKYNLPLLNLFDACILYSPFWDINNGITLCKDCHNKIHKMVRDNKAGRFIHISA